MVLPILAKQTELSGPARDFRRHLTKSFAITNEQFVAFSAASG
jgi:hypothetical protein